MGKAVGRDAGVHWQRFRSPTSPVRSCKSAESSPRIRHGDVKRGCWLLAVDTQKSVDLLVSSLVEFGEGGDIQTAREERAAPESGARKSGKAVARRGLGWRTAWTIMRLLARRAGMFRGSRPVTIIR